MDSQLVAGFDTPQTLPLVSPSFDQTNDWCQYQQETSLPLDEPKFAESFLSPWHFYQVHSNRNFVMELPSLQQSPVYFYEQQVHPNRDFMTELRSLQKHYTVLDSNELIMQALEEEPALYALLIEAVAPLRNAFGERWIIQIRVQLSEDDRLVKVAVQLPVGSVADTESVLRSFDEAWWLNNCHRSGGGLVFDYEIQDGI